MINSTLGKAAASMRGVLSGNDRRFSGISTDTRTLKEGELFFALDGASYNGSDFVDKAAFKHAAAAVVNKETTSNIPQIIVNNTYKALGKLAKWWRNQMDVEIIAVTGSNGKTTLKEMISSCLFSVETLSTEGNLNNHIGLPIMLLRLNREHKIAVLEMGANNPKEISYLTDLASPEIAVINNAFPSHLEGFGSLEGVARAKGEILQGRVSPRQVILNADDQYFPLWKNMIKDVPVTSFGFSSNAIVRAVDIKTTSTESTFTLILPNSSIKIFLPLCGKHNVMNACAAAAVMFSLNVTSDHIKKGLENVSAITGRLFTQKGNSNITIIDDSYNANPASVIAAVEFLSGINGKKWLVLGDMAELGEDSIKLHSQIGKNISNFGIDKLFAIGEMTKSTVSAFGKNGEWYESIEALLMELNALKNQFPSVTLLIKGSRSMRMERVVEALTNNVNEK